MAFEKVSDTWYLVEKRTGARYSSPYRRDNTRTDIGYLARNISGGYWIAEAVPDAARHAPVLRYDRDRIDWLILATDGARDTLEALGVHGPRSPHCPAKACETCSNAATPGKPRPIPTAGRCRAPSVTTTRRSQWSTSRH